MHHYFIAETEAVFLYYQLQRKCTFNNNKIDIFYNTSSKDSANTSAKALILLNISFS